MTTMPDIKIEFERVSENELTLTMEPQVFKQLNKYLQIAVQQADDIVLEIEGDMDESKYIELSQHFSSKFDGGAINLTNEQLANLFSIFTVLSHNETTTRMVGPDEEFKAVDNEVRRVRKNFLDERGLLS